MKKKTFTRITFEERVIIETRYCKDYKSMRSIAEELNRPPSAISREINGKPRKGMGRYRAHIAQRKADTRSKNQGRQTKLSNNKKLKKYVTGKLKLGWSPEQVAIRLPVEYPKDIDMRISYEAIYQYIYNQYYRGGDGYLKPKHVDLRQYLTRRHRRRCKKGARKAQKLANREHLPSIEDRPAVVDTRSRIGDWEDDTLLSRQSKVRIKSVSERRSGIVFFVKTEDGTANSCDEALRKRLEKIPQEFRHTLTRDRGSENMNYQTLSDNLDMDIYFAHAYCSHERGHNENDNGLFRRYYPKKTDFATLTDEEIAAVEYLINSRPRKRLGGLTPFEVFYQETGVALDS